MSTWQNMVCACLKCNVKKGGRTPREARMKLVSRPVRPRHNPLLVLKLQNPKYACWGIWVGDAVQAEAARIMQTEHSHALLLEPRTSDYEEDSIKTA